MTQEEQKIQGPCNPDDLVCQEEVLRRLESIHETIDNEAFLEKYSGLVDKDVIAAEIEKQKIVVQEAVDSCGSEMVEEQPLVEEKAPEE